MLMVWVAGTAIIMSNIDILEDSRKKIVSEITFWQNEKVAIENLLLYADEDFMQEV